MYQSPCRLFLGYTILTTALLDVTVLIYVVRLDSNWSFGLAKHGNTSLTASQLVTRKTFWTSFYIDLLFFVESNKRGELTLAGLFLFWYLRWTRRQSVRWLPPRQSTHTCCPRGMFSRWSSRSSQNRLRKGWVALDWGIRHDQSLRWQHRDRRS